MACFIIAEIGVNHDGVLGRAMSLIEEAKQAGADAAKFQLFSAEKLGRPHLKDFELLPRQMERLAAHCKRVGIEFMCTPFDVDAMSFLMPFLKRIKISSGSVTDKALLEAIGGVHLPKILSTGMSDDHAINIAKSYLNWDDGTDTCLLCTSAYPCPVSDVNLRAMQEGWGFSDHTDGIVMAIAAAARGATIIEKHLTYDRKARGPDHKASIQWRAFGAMVQSIRDVEAAMGDGIKRAMPSEADTMRIWGRV